MKRRSESQHSLRFGQVSELFGHVRWLLGHRQNWIYALPAISVASAVSELVVLVCVVQSLLLLVDPSTSGAIEAGPVAVDLSASGLIATAVAASATSLVLRSLDAMVVGRLAARAVWAARERLIDSYFSADWRAMARLRSGHLQQLLGHNVQTVSGSVPMLGTMLTASINLVLYGTFIAVTSPIVAAMFTSIGVVVLSLFAFLRRRTRVVARESQELVRDVQLTSTTLTTLNRELQLFDVQRAARMELHVLNDSARVALRRMRTLQRLVPALFQQVLLLAVVVLVAFAYWFDVDGSTFGASAILALRSLSYLQQLNTSSQAYLEAAPYLREIRSAIESHVDQARARGALQLERVERIELDSVSFRYDSETVLSDVSLTLAPGDWIGIIGPSGGGKSTLANIVAGLLRPDSGSYLVNDTDSDQFSSASWASTFALLSQEPMLTRGSVEDNIRFFRAGDRRDVEVAAERSAVAAEIGALPDRYDTRVGDGEASLSGGQRQRIALARALFGSPQVLILDEPTSALDAENEHLIEQSLFALDEDVIVLVVSHRPTLLSRCNRFVVVENGRIVHDGGPDPSVQRYVGSAASDGSN